MFGSFKKLGVMAALTPTLAATKTNSRAVQRDIAGHVYKTLVEIETAAESLNPQEQSVMLKARLSDVMADRHRCTALGNRSEADPDYAKAALVESAITAMLSGDRQTVDAAMGALIAWFRDVGVV